ncbi:MAG: DNA protecting protein DprA [Candidatus Colwellbacteria bacterium RIFCSPLOWO2_12_FULL_44_13]|uniref:DNA protecting protein DprA n=3 Tax=Candidatus Colwelliibacteriota TaxID=1817904 RepID=A0A1G1Z9S7_9BACT|nr:MAG: DNA protecting protein DprA [Candidatus Colwellbacteria bacterium RIFCSPHIGHO2_12_FULL_44_17]OGY60620.1 MAG: DNA protecting protein DprA [Candidatus Colwellbacteria bacterium RIFCSPLOWO2_02_FULL_44_20b]OGY61902.1 MAG: DNA protecting protein DprA [Candidatus Colwellbacteria bacterium RIFCSPLOWO2_12_FULL_44_13]
MEHITLSDSDYPSLLRETQAPPERLYFLGTLPSLPMISIVGTRKATPQGLRAAYEFAACFAEHGFAVVSGLALGIDAAAHRGALSVKGQTLAILAHGLHMIYPPNHKDLAEEIVASYGGLISQYEEGVPPLKHRFLERNKLVAGISVATVIIEAPEKSGALVTARLALEANREIFVVPGPIHHLNYRGSHALIREGARLVSSPYDVFQDLGVSSSLSQASSFIPQNEEQRLIISVLRDAGVALHIDKIIELTHFEPQTANREVALLTIQGIIRETYGSYELWVFDLDKKN